MLQAAEAENKEFSNEYSLITSPEAACKVRPSKILLLLNGVQPCPPQCGNVVKASRDAIVLADTSGSSEAAVTEQIRARQHCPKCNNRISATIVMPNFLFVYSRPTIETSFPMQFEIEKMYANRYFEFG